METIVTLEGVLGVYRSVLSGELSYDAADRWALKMMQTLDDRKLIFEPEKDEKLIWDLIQYFFGINMPSMSDRTKTSRIDIDIISFLESKGIYWK